MDEEKYSRKGSSLGKLLAQSGVFYKSFVLCKKDEESLNNCSCSLRGKEGERGVGRARGGEGEGGNAGREVGHLPPSP